MHYHLAIDMKFIKTKNYPLKGYNAITHWPFVFYKGNLSIRTKQHEEIHGAQQKELLIVFFYLIYFVEWIFKGYRGISFEKEAYQNQNNPNYLKTRKIFAQWRTSRAK